MSTDVVVVDVLGWAGAVAVLVGYALVIRRPEAVTGRRYVTLNLAGSAGLAASAATHAAWPSAVLNLLWLGLTLHAFRRATSGAQRLRGCSADAASEALETRIS